MPQQKNAPGPEPAPSGTKPRSLPTVEVALATTLLGMGWLLYLFMNSPGVPVHDELVHVFIAGGAWHSLSDVMDVWGRVGNTVLYMPGAFFGLEGARVESLVFAFITALLTLLLAKRIGAKYLLVVPVLLWFQPWFCDISYTCTTEVPFSLFLVAAMCMLASDNLLGAAAAAGALPLIRHEGLALTGLVALWCLYRRNWPAALAAFAPLAAYNLVCRFTLGFWPSLVYLGVKPTEFYGAGTFSHFVPMLAMGVGLPVLILAANSVVPALASTKRMLVLGFYLVYFVIHAVIYRFGLFSSGGYGLFLVPLAPGLAVAGALGLEFLIDGGRRALEALKLSEGRIRLVGRVGVGVWLALVLVVGFETKPRPLDSEAQVMKSVVEWLRANGCEGRPIYTTHAWLHEFLPNNTNRAPYLPKAPDQMESGAIVVWDAHYSDRFNLKKEVLSDTRKWELLIQSPEGFVSVYRRR